MTDAAWKAVGNAIDTMPGKLHSEKISAIFYAIAALPLADRLAYARGLVEAEGWSLVKVPDERDHMDAPPTMDAGEAIEWANGWNACRAATLATGDRDDHG